jgi:hypothetical protein
MPLASLQIREANARRHANKAEEKFVALAKRARLDAIEIEWIQKERDELLQTTARLRQEHEERESKIEAKNMFAELAVQVGQHRARI